MRCWNLNRQSKCNALICWRTSTLTSCKLHHCRITWITCSPIYLNGNSGHSEVPFQIPVVWRCKNWVFQCPTPPNRRNFHRCFLFWIFTEPSTDLDFRRRMGPILSEHLVNWPTGPDPQIKRDIRVCVCVVPFDIPLTNSFCFHPLREFVQEF